MTYGEAIRLSRQMATDPASHIYAAVNNWPYPMSREALVLADLFDAFAVANSKRRPEPYPRPWRARQKRKLGTPVSIAQYRRIKAAAAAGESRPFNPFARAG